MTFVPDEDLRAQAAFNLAPMIDFLFLMLAVFACLSVSRVALKDTEISLVKTHAKSSSMQMLSPSLDYKFIHITVSEEGKYKWVTEVKDHLMNSAEEIANELLRQYEKGTLPTDKKRTQVLLKIDKKTPWDPILTLILTIKESGFDVRSVYEPTHENSKSAFYE